MKQDLLFLLVFMAIQLGLGFTVPHLCQLFAGDAASPTLVLIVTSAAASLFSAAFFLLMRWAEVSPRWLRSRQWLVLWWSVVAALGSVVPSMWLQEQMPDLPNWAEDQFEQILASRWGYVTIGLLAPFTEELVFRGAILRSLLQRPLVGRWSAGANAWTAVAISALLFALVHANPAQMPHAFLVGLLLGWMYRRTGSILPGMAYHWANNSVAYVLCNLYSNPDLSLADLFGNSHERVLLAVGFSMLILVPALVQLAVWMRRAD